MCSHVPNASLSRSPPLASFFFCIARRHATFIWLVQRNWLVCYMNHIDEVAFSNPYFVSAKCEELNAVRMECTKKHVL